MYQKERLDEILALVRRYGYVTVKYLVAELHYSNATINRDLNILEGQGQLHRTYGAWRSSRARTFPCLSVIIKCVRKS